MPFATRLRELREKAGLTRSQLAEMAGLNQYGIAKLELSQREPAWSTVQALAKALGVSLEAFADDVADTEPTGETPPTPKRGRPRKST